jgi:hypothetical protein
LKGIKGCPGNPFTIEGRTQNEWIKKAPFDNHKLKYKKVVRESLYEDELFKPENRPFENPV